MLLHLRVVRWFKDDDVISGESNSNLVIDRIDRSYHGRTIGCLATNKVASARASTVVQLRCNLRQCFAVGQFEERLYKPLTTLK